MSRSGLLIFKFFKWIFVAENSNPSHLNSFGKVAGIRQKLCWFGLEIGYLMKKSAKAPHFCTEPLKLRESAQSISKENQL
jgi:hypothetical protein